MLQVTSLERRYGDFVAVKDVNFTINHGEITGLLGHNGAGKTTIMKMLSGYLEPCAGMINIDNVDLQEYPKKVQRNLGYLPENLPIYPDMTVVDYLDYAATLKGLSEGDKLQEISRVIAETNIESKLSAKVSTLSRGYKQRVGVAQAIIGKPRLLILDEPTNGLDPTQTQHMRELIKALSRHATVILSTHIMQEVEALCDRVLIINGGQLMIDKKLEDLKESNLVELKSNIPLNVLKEKLREVNSITDITLLGSEQDNLHQYRLKLSSNENQQETSAKIARLVLRNDFDLYSIHPVRRNLESLFHQAGKKEELSNAA